jgi:Mn-dependent DtxR family transcriptional regulator
MTRLPKWGEAKAARLHSIEKLGTHTPGTAAAWRMAEDMERIGLLQKNRRGFELTEAGRAHMVELRRQRDVARAERGW